MKKKSFVLAALLSALGVLTFLPGATAAEAVKFPKASKANSHKLTLNGSATRTVFGFEVYQVGLYVTERSNDERVIYNNPDKKRIQIKMLRDVTGKKFESTVRKNIETNFSSAEKKRYCNELERFLDCFVDKNLEENCVVHIDFLPGKGTQIAVAGKRIDLIEGDAFYHALLRLWIGNPPQESVKDGLLGKA